MPGKCIPPNVPLSHQKYLRDTLEHQWHPEYTFVNDYSKYKTVHQLFLKVQTSSKVPTLCARRQMVSHRHFQPHTFTFLFTILQIVPCNMLIPDSDGNLPFRITQYSFSEQLNVRFFGARCINQIAGQGKGESVSGFIFYYFLGLWTGK